MEGNNATTKEKLIELINDVDDDITLEFLLAFVTEYVKGED